MHPKREILSIDDLERHASNHLPKMVRDYYNGAALDGITHASNLASYRQYYIRPRVLRNVSNIDTSTVIFNNKIPFPCCVAPAAMQKMAHPDGEEATARACGNTGVIMGLSTFSTTSLEDVKKIADQARQSSMGKLNGNTSEAECVLQMYLFENRETTNTLIRRAEEAGYKAIVLTVDTPYFGRRLTEIRNGFMVPPHLRMANFDETLRVKTGSQLRTEENNQNLDKAPNDEKPRQSAPPPNKNDPSLTWDIVEYLHSITKLPIWLKGILTPEDAILAIEHGADAIVVSNHGGRQLDHAPPTLDVLPDIVKAVNGRIPVHVDGGVRRGSDIFKALCLGADMVWIGRPVLWGLSFDGENGVNTALKILEDEFRACMGLAGCLSLRDLRPEMLIKIKACKI